MSMIISSP